MAKKKPPEKKPEDFAGRFTTASSEGDKIELTAKWILQEFDAYYSESRHIPALAQQAFENRDPGQSLELSRRRLSIYSEVIEALGPKLLQSFPDLNKNEKLWKKVEKIYLPLIKGRYESDLASAFVNSARRMVCQGEWLFVDYGFIQPAKKPADFSKDIRRDYPGGAKVSAETVWDILKIPGFKIFYQDIQEDAHLIADKVNRDLKLGGRKADAVKSIQMINAGFFRNRGAYLVGRIQLKDDSFKPFIIALLNDKDGIYADAVLTSRAHAHNIFSSTLANFHVTNARYHELAAFLHTIMPRRSLGLHYSTIGFNHVGKVAVMNEIKDQIFENMEKFEPAVGHPGTVAIAFSSPSSTYTLKVLRDKPTAQYKWGKFEGTQSVFNKYNRVHEINRTGSMLDNLIYYNLRFDDDWFDKPLLEELLSQASETVIRHGNTIIFKHLITQAKMIPIPTYIKSATRAKARMAIANLGHCIKNNAAANVFNKDLDARNYGIGDYMKVYLFDYDALEPFTTIKIRTNQDRFDGEEDVPDWFFEEGEVFLPEEIEVGLRIEDRELSKYFRDVHGDLLTVEYWEGIQQTLKDGYVPATSAYPEDCRLVRELDRLGTYY